MNNEEKERIALTKKWVAGWCNGEQGLQFYARKHSAVLWRNCQCDPQKAMNSRLASKSALTIDPRRPRLLSSLYSVLFILTWALVGLAAFRNTLTW
ncbi:hypothetical protein Bhyg_10784 [Pseudolycoriella hygida]|uniref:Uncharacterized protein n=1 Tax=Pseudolycoriella hygida TaxID=35572 RepID=A0A9Q0MU55_9DIPT|nr:hypothetical protein Bhyg_10784 [Pseudolycoriella hygida]